METKKVERPLTRFVPSTPLRHKAKRKRVKASLTSGQKSTHTHLKLKYNHDAKAPRVQGNNNLGNGGSHPAPRRLLRRKKNTKTGGEGGTNKKWSAGVLGESVAKQQKKNRG